jgi:hypothetical protein
MLELELDKVVATLVNFNPRAEKNGKERVPAADLSIRVARDADVLAYFAPTLKSMIFDHAGPRDLAEGMPLRDKHMVYPLKRDEEMTGATVTIDYGVKETIELADCRLKGLRDHAARGRDRRGSISPCSASPTRTSTCLSSTCCSSRASRSVIEPRDEEDLPR